MIEPAEVVVIANGNPMFRQVPGQVREDQVLIDLVGAANGNSGAHARYEGIAW